MTITPYQRLMQAFREFVHSAIWPRKVTMFHIPKKEIFSGTTWGMRDVYERTTAAQQIGYTVELFADNTGLTIMYSKYPKQEPDEVKYWD